MSTSLYILDKQEKVINFLKNSGGASECSPFFDDVLTEDLQTGSETFQFTTISKGDLARDLSIGNYVAFKRNGKTKLFQIVQTEETHDETVYVTVYCECAGLELINKVFRKRTLTSVSLRRFLETILDETGWSVGYVDASSTVSLDLEIGDENIYAILQNNLSNFGVELEFRVELNGGGISNKYVDTYYKRGTVTGKRFTFGKDIEGITRKTDSTSLYTALIGRGKNGLTFRDIQVEGINKPIGQDYVADQESFDKYNHNGYHIVGVYNFDTESPQELLRETYKRLQEVKEPKVEYEIPVAILGDLLGASWETISIGDTVGVYDNAFNPPIRLMARVSKLETSFTNPQGNKCTLANFVEVGSNITDEMRKIASKLEGYVDAQFPIGGDKIQDGAIGQDQMNQEYMSQISADIISASVIQAERIVADEIEAVTGRFENIEAEHGSFKEITTNKIEAIEGNFNEINADLGNFKEISTDKISAVEGKFDKVQADLVKTNTIVAGLGEFDLVVTDRINAVDGKFETIKSELGDFKEITTNKLTATEGRIEELDSDLITTKTIVGNLGKFDDVIAERVDAVEGTFVELEAEVGRINTLVSGNITSDNIHSSGISSDKLTIRDGFIKNAMIDTVNASKITAGEINTNKVHITSANGGIVIADNTQQFKDKNGKVRIQMGQDASGNFNFGVFDATGSGTLIDATGVKEKALADGIIKDRMIGQGEIGGNKINISSMIDEVNKESNTKTIKGSKVQLDTEGQTLDVAFNSLKTNVDNIEFDGRNLLTRCSQYTSSSPLNLQTTRGDGYFEELGIPTSVQLESGIYTLQCETNGTWCKTHNGAQDPTKKYCSLWLFRKTTTGVSTGHIFIDMTRKNPTVTISEKATYYLRVNLYSDGVTNVSIDFWNIKLEKGDKKTGYSPAPEDINSRIESNTTAISVQQGKINTLIQDTTIEKNGQSLKLKDEYSKLEQTVSGISSTVGSHTSSITNLGAQVDSKAKVFTSTPTVPYKVGDLWVQGSSGEIMKCKTARTTGSYNSSDWEKASKYTDDSKANQVESNLSNLSGKVTEVESKQATFKQDLDGFKQNVSSTYATKEQFNLANGKLNELEKNVETTKSQVAEVTTSLDGITQRVNSTETKVESISKSVSDKANSKDVYTKSDVYTKNETNSQINIAKNEINLGVSNTYETKTNVETKISSIQVGGTNLVENSAFLQGKRKWSGNILVDINKKLGSHPSAKISKTGATSDTWYGTTQTLTNRTFFNGETYTVSCWYYCEDINTFDGKFGLELKGNKEGTTSDAGLVGIGIPKTDLVQGKWTRVVLTKTLNANWNNVYAYCWVQKNGTIWVTDIQVEKGNKATDWSPAPEDSDYSISQAEQNAIDSASTDATNKVNSAKSELNTAINNIKVGGRNLLIHKDEIKNTLLNPNGELETNSSTTNTMKDFITVKPKEVLTFQKETSNEYFRWNWYDSDKVYMSRKPDNSNLFQWTVPEGAYYIRVSYPNTGNVKVERGNKATDWTPAPEDVDSAINSKANSSDVYNKTEVYTKTETNSQINIAKEEINLGVSNTYETKTNVENKINAAVDNVQVGGRNLALGTGKATGDVSSGSGSSPYSATDLFSGITAIKTNTAWTGRYFNLKAIAQRGGFKAGDNLVLSVYIKADQNVTLNVTSHRTKGTGNIPGSSKSYTNFTVTPKWQQVWFPFVADEGSLNRTDARIEVNIATGNNYIHWAGWKLEKGTKPSDWSPAPEDVQANIDKKANSTDVYTKSEVFTKAETNSAINVAKDAINLGVSQTYETKSNVESKISSANTTTLNSAKSYADTKKNEAISSASADATNKVNTAKSELNTAINNISVGGRNYILNSKNLDTVANENFSKAYVLSNDFANNIRNKDVTISATVSYDNMTLGSNYHYGVDICVTYADDTKTWINLTKDKGLPNTSASSQPKRYSATTKVLDKAIKSISNTTVFIRGYTDIRNFIIKDVMVEIGSKASDFTIAPEDTISQINTKANSTDVYTKTEVYTKNETNSQITATTNAITSRVSSLESKEVANRKVTAFRYVRDWLRGSTANTGNHWVELQVWANGSNIAEGKTVTTNGTVNSSYPINRFTDGNTSSSQYAELQNDNSWRYLQVDLGEVHYNIDYLRVWHYYNDLRRYNHKLEVSVDGSTWYTIYNSEISGAYTETADGRVHIINETSTEKRLKTAESKITDSAIINTVSSTIQNAKNEAINSANSSTDNKLQNYATNSSLTQTAENITAKFEASGGSNLLQNSGFKTGDISRWWIHHYNNPTGCACTILNSSAEWGFPDSSVNCCQIQMSNQSGKEYGIAQTFSTTIGKKYTISLYYAGHRVNGATIIVRNSNNDWIASKSFYPSEKHGGNSNISNWGSVSLTFTATQSSLTLNLVLNSAENNGHFWIAKPQIVEGEVALPYSPHPNEIYSGSTVIDASGVTINNGAIKIKNKAGDTVLSGDTSGNLMLSGHIISDANISGGIISGGIVYGGNPLNSSAILDSNGLTVNNGALRVKDGSGNTMLEGDASGTLYLRKQLKVGTIGTFSPSGVNIAGGSFTVSGGTAYTELSTGYLDGSTTSQSLYDNGLHGSLSRIQGSQIFRADSFYGSNGWSIYEDNSSNAMQQSYKTYSRGSGIYIQATGSNKGRTGNLVEATRLNHEGLKTTGSITAGRYYLTDSENAYLTNNSNTGVKIQSPHGYVAIGPQNSGYCHYVTDRPTHWFDRNVAVQGEIRCGSGYNQLVPYGSMYNGYDNGTSEVCEGRIHIGGNKYIYYGWCSINCTAGASAERTYTVPNLSRIRGISIQCYTKGGTANFGELALKQTYSNGFTFRLYNATNGGAHYITYMIIGE